VLYHYNNGIIDNTQIIWEKGEIIQSPSIKEVNWIIREYYEKEKADNFNYGAQLYVAYVWDYLC